MKNIRIDDTVYSDITEISKKHKRSKQAEVEIALTNHINNIKRIQNAKRKSK